MPKTPARPDMSSYFKARIDWHVNGMMSSGQARKPADVMYVIGDVTDSIITVETRNGDKFQWAGGKFSSRKVNGCYAPLMPKPVK